MKTTPGENYLSDTFECIIPDPAAKKNKVVVKETLLCNGRGNCERKCGGKGACIEGLFNFYVFAVVVILKVESFIPPPNGIIENTRVYFQDARMVKKELSTDIGALLK